MKENQKLKPILIIAASSKKLAPFVDLAGEFSPAIILATWDQVFVSSQKNGVFLDLLNQKIDLKQFSLVFFRTVGQYIANARLVIDYLVKNKITIVDRLWSADPNNLADASKVFEYLRLTEAKLPVPDFIYGSFESILANGSSLGFPLVLKRSKGSQGKQVFLAKNRQQLESFRDELGEDEKRGYFYLAQKFIENDGDFRIFVLGERALGAIKRTRQDKLEFRNNVSLGGLSQEVDLPDEIISLALRAARICRVDIAGVDIVLSKRENNKPYLFEVNAAPQFAGFSKATGINVPKEIVNYLILRARNNE